MRGDVPFANIMRAMNGTSSTRAGITALNDTSRELSRAMTPYGPVATTITLKCGHVVYANNPLALVWAAAQRSPKFSRFLQSRLEGRNSAIVIYLDETVPGNNLRPDKGRSYEALLWTFADLPSWYRDRRHGYMKFAFVLSRTVEEMEGGLPELTEQMLLQFFHPSKISFATASIELPVGRSSESWRCDAHFGFFCIDERAVKFITDVKGAGGLNFCCCCKNMMKHCSASEYFVDGTEHRREKWDPHTPESFRAMKAELDSVKDDPAALKEMEIQCGLNYNPEGLLWDEYISDLIQMPNCIFWDTQHCIYASGGIAQYEVNGFVLEALQHNITLADLDAFASDMKGHKLGRSFFSTRIVNRDGAHIKAFASETIDAVKVLAAFGSIVCSGAGVMPDHVRSMSLLNSIGDILLAPRDINHNVDTLEQQMEEHHELVIALYHTTPKAHSTRHIVDAILRFRVQSTCFAPERSHSDSKSIARHCFRNCTKTLLDRSNFAFTYDLDHSETMFEEIYLPKPNICESLGELVSEYGTEVYAGFEIMSHIGNLKRNDYVYLVPSGATVPILGHVLVFIEVKGDAFLVVFQPYRRVGEQEWAEDNPASVANVRRVVRKDIVYVMQSGPVVVRSSF